MPPDPLDVHRTAAEGFGKAADAYERSRPDYPPEAAAWLIEKFRLAAGQAVVDLGAGTGKWTRMLLPSRATVIAIEPVDGMREKFGELLPDVLIAPGTAEFITLPSGTVEAVTCAQSFHWFDGPKALGEIHRVLRPGGGLALIWNGRDASVDWVAELNEIVDVHRGDTPDYRAGAWRKAFEKNARWTPLEYRDFYHFQSFDVPGLVERVASISYVATLPDDERRQVFDAVRRLAQEHPDLAGRSRIELPYRTDVYWCFKR